VTEMIRTSNLVHKGLVNIYPNDPNTEQDARSMQDMNFGNKIALLGGDYLLGHCCSELANLRNSEVRWNF
jgi:decaprenyl-diphosphate synthase subunit 2